MARLSEMADEELAGARQEIGLSIQFVDQDAKVALPDTVGIARTPGGNYLVYVTDAGGKIRSSTTHKSKGLANAMALRRMQAMADAAGEACDAGGEPEGGGPQGCYYERLLGEEPQDEALEDGMAFALKHVPRQAYSTADDYEVELAGGATVQAFLDTLAKRRDKRDCVLLRKAGARGGLWKGQYRDGQMHKQAWPLVPEHQGMVVLRAYASSYQGRYDFTVVV